MKTYIIIDSKLMAYTASYQRGQPIMATLTSIEQAVKFIVDSGQVETEEYEVIMGFDFEKSRYRKELLGSYKGHRPQGKAAKSPEEAARYQEFQDDYRHVLPILTDALGLMVMGVSEVEFDDLGSIMAYFLQGPVIMVTEDHDLLQLVVAMPEKVRQFMPRSYSMVGPEEVEQIEGVTTKEEFLVKKAIKGDSGDSIRGLVQCGDKCFDDWFPHFKGLGMNIHGWKAAFLELAESKTKFGIHDEYKDLVDNFSDMFDINIALGETMTDTAKFSESENDEFLKALSEPRGYSEVNYYNAVKKHTKQALNDFGDPITPSTFPYLRGNKGG